MACAALGAMIGDHVPYTVGRFSGPRLVDGMKPGTRRKCAHDWLVRELTIRGGVALLTSRFLAAGRTLVTFSTGMLRYPLRKFSFWTAISASVWGGYLGLVGYLGGLAFQGDVFIGMVVGISLAWLLSFAIEDARRRKTRRAEDVEPVPSER